MGKTLLLTGHPQIGKTTIIRRVVEKLGNRAGGFYTEEIFGPGGRKGFNLITLDGESVVLSHKDFRDAKTPRVGRYGVDVNALERVGVAEMQKTMDAGKVLVVDEIGKMELLSKSFSETLLSAILGPTMILGTIIYKPYPDADVFKALAQVTLWEVNKLNRDKLHRKVLKWCE